MIQAPLGHHDFSVTQTAVITVSRTVSPFRQPRSASLELSLFPSVRQMAAIVKAFRMSAGRRREGMHGGRRPKSLEGRNRGGVRTGAVSGYGDLAPVFDLIFEFRSGATAERLLQPRF